MPTRRVFVASCAALLPARAFASGSIDEPAVDAASFRLGPFMLEDVNGTIVDLETLAGKFVLMFFGYTFCPDVCPTALAAVSAALKQLDESDRQRLLAFFVSLDPARDTRKVLSDYAAAFDEQIVPLRGPKAYTDSLAAQFGVTYTVNTPDPARPEDYTLDHTANIFFLDPDGALIRTFAHGIGPDDLAKAVREALRQRPAP